MEGRSQVTKGSERKKWSGIKDEVLDAGVVRRG